MRKPSHAVVQLERSAVASVSDIIAKFLKKHRV